MAVTVTGPASEMGFSKPDPPGVSKRTVERALNPKPSAPKSEADVIERQVAALMTAWNKASSEARDALLQSFP